MREFKRNSLSTLVIAVSLALPMIASAQDRETAPPSTAAQRPAQPANPAAADTSKVSRSDTKFMKEAAMGGMLEVELGRLAVQNAASDQVKQFGQRMVDDHGKANDELKSLAQAEGVSLPTELDAKHAREVQKFQKLTGAQFDREYMKMMVEDHHKDIKAFEHEAKRGDDPEVKAFADKTLPTLKEHLSMADQARHTVEGKGSTMPESANRNDSSTERPAAARQQQ
jgi:putative membrane protein